MAGHMQKHDSHIPIVQKLDHSAPWKKPRSLSVETQMQKADGTHSHLLDRAGVHPKLEQGAEKCLDTILGAREEKRITSAISSYVPFNS